MGQRSVPTRLGHGNVQGGLAPRRHACWRQACAKARLEPCPFVLRRRDGCPRAEAVLPRTLRPGPEHQTSLPSRRGRLVRDGAGALPCGTSRLAADGPIDDVAVVVVRRCRLVRAAEGRSRVANLLLSRAAERRGVSPTPGGRTFDRTGHAIRAFPRPRSIWRTARLARVKPHPEGSPGVCARRAFARHSSWAAARPPAPDTDRTRREGHSRQGRASACRCPSC
jgi:hypothetical protein